MRHTAPFVVVLLGFIVASCAPAIPPSPTATPTPTVTPTLIATLTPTATPLGGGGYIAFSSGPPEVGGIGLVSPEGTGFVRLTACDGFSPAWSPDGTSLAFVSSLYQGKADINLIKADGSARTNLTNSVADEFDPAWSSDGTRIAFASNARGNFDIYVMSADGADPTRLTNSPDDELGPAWAPNGKQIAFSLGQGTAKRIFVMNDDGSNPIPLADSSPGANDTSPSWSPDGATIAFASNRTGDYEIFTMRSDGTNLANLTTHTGNDFSPVWSPDGQQIAFASDRDSASGQLPIYVMNALGGPASQVSAAYGSPAWSPRSAVPLAIPPPISEIAPAADATAIPGNSNMSVALTGYRLLDSWPTESGYFCPDPDAVFLDLGLHAESAPQSSYSSLYGVNVYVYDANGRKSNPLWMGGRVAPEGQSLNPLEDIEVTWDRPTGVNSFRLWKVDIENGSYIRVVFQLSRASLERAIKIDFAGVGIVIDQR